MYKFCLEKMIKAPAVTCNKTRIKAIIQPHINNFLMFIMLNGDQHDNKNPYEDEACNCPMSHLNPFI